MSAPILQSSQANWVLGKNNGQWTLADDKGNPLFLFPACLSDAKEVNAIKRMAMLYEQRAYDEGVEMGKAAMLTANSIRMQEMHDQILLLEHMNEDLASKLTKFFEDVEE